jgi:hypothetical protein
MVEEQIDAPAGARLERCQEGQLFRSVIEECHVVLMVAHAVHHPALLDANFTGGMDAEAEGAGEGVSHRGGSVEEGDVGSLDRGKAADSALDGWRKGGEECVHDISEMGPPLYVQVQIIRGVSMEITHSAGIAFPVGRVGILRISARPRSSEFSRYALDAIRFGEHCTLGGEDRQDRAVSCAAPLLDYHFQPGGVRPILVLGCEMEAGGGPVPKVGLNQVSV